MPHHAAPASPTLPCNAGGETGLGIDEESTRSVRSQLPRTPAFPLNFIGSLLPTGNLEKLGKNSRTSGFPNRITVRHPTAPLPHIYTHFHENQMYDSNAPAARRKNRRISRRYANSRYLAGIPGPRPLSGS